MPALQFGGVAEDQWLLARTGAFGDLYRLLQSREAPTRIKEFRGIPVMSLAQFLESRPWEQRADEQI